MVHVVEELLGSPTRFQLAEALASPQVVIANPAVGTGTFLLGIIESIADRVREDQGPGAVAAAIKGAVERLIGFEIQLGPFAVAQLRVLAELDSLTHSPTTSELRMFVADTLANPYIDEGWFPSMYQPIAASRKQAAAIKRDVPITVVIGNPPYKEKAKGHGGWVENGGGNIKEEAPLLAWIPPKNWGVGVHAKHLRNLYVYFWRWAAWKVFDHHPAARNGAVCFISVAGFLDGPGFQKMRDYRRRTCDEICAIDCSPEGHQPDVNTRIFSGVQQPICIVITS